MRRVILALLLVTLALAKPTVIVYFTTNKTAVALTKIIVKGSIEENGGFGKVLKAINIINSTLYNAQCCVKEDIVARGNSYITNSLIKKGNLKGTISILSNKNVSEATLRVKGSLIVAFFFVRDSDITMKLITNNIKKEGTLEVKGYVVLPAPKRTVENLLKVYTRNIKNYLEKYGVKVSIYYNVKGKLVPPISKVDIDIKVTGNKDNVLKIANSLGIKNYINVFNITEYSSNTIRKVKGSFTATAKLTRFEGRLTTFITLHGSLHGDYYNTTVNNEISRRIKLLTHIIGTTSISQYLMPTNKVITNVLNTVTGKKVELIINAKGILFKNTKGFWNAVEDLLKNGKISEVICNGKVIKTNLASTCS